MELLEFGQERRLSREQAAEWLRQLADSLERHNGVEFVQGGIRTKVAVPDEVDMELEIEIGSENEIEIEIRW